MSLPLFPDLPAIVECTNRTYLRRIYSLYLEGHSIEEIRRYLSYRHNVNMSDEEIDELIDRVNEFMT